jgi:hypothetical protein
MSLAATYSDQLPRTPFWPSLGQSPAAKKISDQVARISESWQNTGSAIVFEQPTMERLYQLKKECENSNWGGDNEAPISVASFLDAVDFLNALPPKLPAPEISVEPSGFVSFEWYAAPYKSAIIAFRGGGSIGYSVLLSRDRTAFGNEQFYSGQISLNLFRHIFSVSK